MVYVSKKSFLVSIFKNVQKCPKMSGSLFSVQKNDRHKNIYKDLNNFLHHALILKLPVFLQKSRWDF